MSRLIDPVTLTQITPELYLTIEDLIDIGSGDALTNTSTSVINEIVLFADTSGKLLKRATGTGITKITSGVLGIASGTDITNAIGTAMVDRAAKLYDQVNDGIMINAGDGELIFDNFGDVIFGVGKAAIFRTSLGAAPINPLATDALWNIKGDLAVASADNTAQRLAVGANGTFLLADSAQTTGLRWGSDLTIADAGTNTVVNALVLDHESTATPTTAFGVGLQFKLESSTTPAQEAGRIYAAWMTATHASRDSEIVLQPVNDGVLQGGVIINSLSHVVAPVFEDGDGFFRLHAPNDMPHLDGGSFGIDFDFGGLTNDRIITVPDKSGTVALLDDISTTTTLNETDDFFSGLTDSGHVGKLGWQWAEGTIGTVISITNHPGILNRGTGTTSGTIAWIYPGSIQAFTSTDMFDITWIVRLNTNDANTTCRIGVGMTISSNQPTDGSYFEKLDGDTNWFMINRASSTQTRSSSGIAVSTNWAKFRVRRINGTTIGFTVDSNSEQTVNTNSPQIAVHPFIHIINSTISNKNIDIDFCGMKMSGLTR